MPRGVPNRTRVSTVTTTEHTDSREHAPEAVTIVPMVEAATARSIEIEPAAAAAADALAYERFMQEIVEINIPTEGKEGELPIVDPCVNGIRAYIQRGVDTKVKRFHVEALLNARTATYDQHTQQMGSDIQVGLKKTEGLSYSMVVVNDTPQGREWARKKMQTRG
jgi:hypothetical protein